MNLKELKRNISLNILDDSLLLFKYSDNRWLINKYIESISKIKNREIVYIHSLEDINNYEDGANYLYVLEVEEINSINLQYKNLIMISKKINKELDYIDFPKLESWQIQDYLKINLDGLEKGDLDFLFNITKNDIYLLDNELNKLKIFSKPNQSLVLHLLKKENNYREDNTYSTFELSNYIIKRDTANIGRILEKDSTIEPFALLSLLINQFKNIIKVQMSPKGIRPENLGMDIKKYKSIEYNINKYSNGQLLNIYEFLTDIDWRVKEGLLDMSKEFLLGYIVNKIICMK